MELKRKLCAMRRKLSQRYWLDDSLGCCLLMWYCPFNFPFNFHYNFPFYFRKFSYFQNLEVMFTRLFSDSLCSMRQRI